MPTTCSSVSQRVYRSSFPSSRPSFCSISTFVLLHFPLSFSSAASPYLLIRVFALPLHSLNYRCRTNAPCSLPSPPHLTGHPRHFLRRLPRHRLHLLLHHPSEGLTMERAVVAGRILRRVAAGFGDEVDVESGLVVNSHFVFRSFSASFASGEARELCGRRTRPAGVSLVTSNQRKRGRKQRMGGENDTILIASDIGGKATTRIHTIL
jgi:hypothetical protein